jgi:hypothetical protein
MLQNLRAWGGPVRVMVRFAGQPPIIRDYGSMGEAKVDVKRMYRAFAPRAAHFVLAQGAMKR